MYKLLSIISVLILVTSVYFFYALSRPTVYTEPRSKGEKSLHRYGDSSTSVENVHVVGFYFVPKDRKVPAGFDWRQSFERSLVSLKSFTEQQFKGRTKITYEIYPEPVVGNGNGQAYDSDDTDHGNPHALVSIANELESRRFLGDDKKNEYRVVYILYEGVGAAGSDNVALLSRKFLTNSEYGDYKESLFAHEFFHTLGLLDNYTLPGALATSTDLMGYGRFVPIENSHIDYRWINAMGN